MSNVANTSYAFVISLHFHTLGLLCHVSYTAASSWDVGFIGSNKMFIELNWIYLFLFYFLSCSNSSNNPRDDCFSYVVCVCVRESKRDGKAQDTLFPGIGLPVCVQKTPVVDWPSSRSLKDHVKLRPFFKKIESPFKW